MSKLLEDPKVAALVEKSATSAVKVETKRILEVVKSTKEAAKDIEDKIVKKVVLETLKDIEGQIKQAA